MTTDMQADVEALAEAFIELREAYRSVRSVPAVSAAASLRSAYDRVCSLATPELEKLVYELRCASVGRVNHEARLQILKEVESSPFWGTEQAILNSAFTDAEVAGMLVTSRERLRKLCKKQPRASHRLASRTPVRELVNRLRSRGLAVYLESPTSVSRRDRRIFDAIVHNDLPVINAAIVLLRNAKTERKIVFGVSYAMAVGAVA